MDNPEQPSNWQDKDMTVPLVLAGVFSGIVFACLCLALPMFRNYLGVGYVRDLIEPTPAPTTVLTPLPNSIYCPAVPEGWFRTTDEKFGLSSASWPVGRQVEEYAETDLQIKDGVLRFSVLPDQSVYSFRQPAYSQARRDFYLVTNVSRVRGPLDTEYGVVFRMTGNRHYFFGINDRQEILLRSHADDGWEETLFNGFFRGIRPGESNELTVSAQGTHFVFCINQTVVAEVENGSYLIGKFGIATSMEGASEQAVIEYEDFIIYSTFR
jgi:hypothetical protein